MSPRWSPAASADLLDAVAYFRDEVSAHFAEQFIDSVEQALELLTDGRFDGPTVTLTTGEDVRVWSVGQYRLYDSRVRGAL